jgi:MoxR-like ATPase
MTDVALFFLVVTFLVLWYVSRAVSDWVGRSKKAMKAIMNAASSKVSAAVAVVPALPKLAKSPTWTKVSELRKNLNVRFVERNAEIDGLLVAALAGEHCLMIGPPGTGKSALARAFSDALSGATYFEWLLTRFSTPEELYGPISLSGLKVDRFARVTAGKLPEAHVAFLDEIFKANSAVLNSLLAAVNERVFHDDGLVKNIPLLTCVAASNEMPEGPELAALWDRFVIRHFVAYTKQETSFASMLRSAPVAAPDPITLDEWGQIRTEVDAIVTTDALFGGLFVLRAKLAGIGVEVSDRRWVKAVKLLRAYAWLTGSPEVAPYHMAILTSCLWNTVDQVDLVRAEVMKIAGAEVLKAEGILGSVHELLKTLPGDLAPDFLNRASAVREEMKKAMKMVEELKGVATDAHSKERITSVVQQIRNEGAALNERLKKSVGIDGF